MAGELSLTIDHMFANYLKMMMTDTVMVNAMILKKKPGQIFLF